MTQHEQGSVRVVREYNFDTLGAPFRVTLKNGVTAEVDANGTETVHIPDMMNLFGAIVRARVLHPRKLSGLEVKFVRRALGVKAKLVAEYLDMTPEHLSRIEAQSTLSVSTEKQFRLASFFASAYPAPEMFFEAVPAADDDVLEKSSVELAKSVESIVKLIMGMKLQSVRPADEELHFALSRRPRRKPMPEPVCDEERSKVWDEQPLLAAA